MHELKNTPCELFVLSNPRRIYGIAVRNPVVAGKLNAYLGYYPSDTEFDQNEEALFKFDELQLKAVMSIVAPGQTYKVPA